MKTYRPTVEICKQIAEVQKLFIEPFENKATDDFATKLQLKANQNLMDSLIKELHETVIFKEDEKKKELWAARIKQMKELIDNTPPLELAHKMQGYGMKFKTPLPKLI